MKASLWNSFEWQKLRSFLCIWETVQYVISRLSKFCYLFPKYFYKATSLSAGAEYFSMEFGFEIWCPRPLWSTQKSISSQIRAIATILQMSILLPWVGHGVPHFSYCYCSKHSDRQASDEVTHINCPSGYPWGIPVL